MKTSTIFVAATAALASAQAPPEGTNKITCAKPNANYCYGADIIVRCDANAIGTAGRCSDNVAGYPPLGGVAECYQSTETSGDAACQKNCVVYAQPSFTLAASQCTPSFTASATGTATPTTLETSAVVTSAVETSAVETSAVATSAPGTVIYTTTVVNGTVTLTVPCTTVASSVTGVVPPPITPPVTVVTATPTGTGVIPPPISPVTSVVVVTPTTPVGTGVPPPPPAGGNQTAPPTGTNTPVGPTSTGSGTIPTNAAVANRATGALAVMGLVAAYFL